MPGRTLSFVSDQFSSDWETIFGGIYDRLGAKRKPGKDQSVSKAGRTLRRMADGRYGDDIFICSQAGFR